MSESYQVIDEGALSESPDFTACATEPIHIPGAVQPHGVLVSLNEADWTIQQISTSAREHFGKEPSTLLGTDFRKLVTDADVDLLTLALQAELETVDPVTITIETASGGSRFDAILHRVGTSLVVELEPSAGAEQSLHTSYRAMRAAANNLNAAVTFEDLAQVTAQEVQGLTGFDRVMIYRFDHDANGEVIAEAARDGLMPMVGLNFPESDIPAQARRLYVENWLRIIPNSDYQPSALEPPADPSTGQPLDLSASVLRSVSPVHLTYLSNMGVKASMSISLIHKGKLWGLIACHHYDSALYVPYSTRSAAEFLGQTASVLLGAKEESATFDQALLVRSVQAQLLDALAEREDDPVAALLSCAASPLDLVSASGVIISVAGEQRSLGDVPSGDDLQRLVRWLWPSPSAADFFSTSALGVEEPTFSSLASGASGLIAARATSQSSTWIMWFRPEVPTTVSWAGDPRQKVVDISAPGGLGPRRSFEKWTETLRGRSKAWTSHELLAASELANRLFAQIVRNLHQLMGDALSEQAHFTLQELPTVDGLDLAAEYRPGGDSLLGGDWYDAIPLPDSRVALVIGDVAGHGAVAASTMAQLRTGMRAYLVENSAPATALHHLNELVSWLLPNAMATGIVAVFNRSTMTLEISSAGHLPPLLIHEGNVSSMQLPRSPALGISDASRYETAEVQLAPGDIVIMYTDGLVERRNESLMDGIHRLEQCAQGMALDDLDKLSACMTEEMTSGSPHVDDVTVLAMRVPFPH